MTTPAEAAADLYGQLKPEAIVQAREYVMSHTPADIQQEMLEIIEADLADAVIPADAAIVSNGSAVNILALPAGEFLQGSPATAVVIDGVFLRANFQMPLSRAFVDHEQLVGVKDMATAVDLPGSEAAEAFVQANTLSYVRLPLPATHALVNEGQAVVVNDTAGVPNAGSPGVAKVASGLLASVDIN